MKLSRYFANLRSSYNAELDDLRTDSEGNNVLKARLAKKREQVPQLLMMMKFSPEMVAVAFHGGFFFKDVMIMESLIRCETNKFPTWEKIKKAILIEPWAQKLVDIVLTDPDGETFLITTAGLEYLYKNAQINSRPAPKDQDEDSDENEDSHEHEDDNNDAYLNSDERFADEGETTEYDLDQAGADWLAEQGFDRKE